jgi:metal-dependent hydrolase (beta-lactamase superfamily II)
VLDSGFDFLRDFHDAGFDGRGISAVVVSHNHPDQNDDLRPVEDLRYELFKRLAGTRARRSEPYVPPWDEDTKAAVKLSAKQPAHDYQARG